MTAALVIAAHGMTVRGVLQSKECSILCFFVLWLEACGCVCCVQLAVPPALATS
jgi:hypothetical protein